MTEHLDVLGDFPEGAPEAIVTAANRVLEVAGNLEEFEISGEGYDSLIMALADYHAVRRHHNLDTAGFAFAGDADEDLPKIKKLVVSETADLRYDARLRESRMRLERGSLSATNTIETEELERIQSYVNSIRDAIRDAESIPAAHRTRLLRRLERLQSELHEDRPLLDRILGGWIRIGTAMAAFHEEIRPVLKDWQETLRLLIEIEARSADLLTYGGAKPVTDLLGLPWGESAHEDDHTDAGDTQDH